MAKLDEKGKRKEKEYEQVTCGMLFKLPQFSILTPRVLNESADMHTVPQFWKWYILWV